MEKSEIFKRLEGVKNLPTLPVVIQKLTAEVRNPNSDATKIARIIEDDPAMMAKILKVVNSALYAASQPITSVQQAVARMGLNAVSNVAMSTAVFSTFTDIGPSSFDKREFWKHSICTGIATHVLYAKAAPNLKKRYTKDILHLSGLMHDIGKIIFEQFFHTEFSKALLNSAERKIPLYQVELELIGSDHAQVGEWLGNRWKLSDDLVSVIRWHHEPLNASEQSKELVMLSHAANYICNLEKIGNSGDMTAPLFFQSIWKQLGMTVADIPPITDKIIEESKQSEVLLSLM